jgi:hypothetical protein
MTLYLGAQPPRAPPLTAHRTATPDFVLALNLLCHDADARALSLCSLTRDSFGPGCAREVRCASRALLRPLPARLGGFSFTYNCKQVGWHSSTYTP